MATTTTTEIGARLLNIAAVDGWSLRIEDSEPNGRWFEYEAVRGAERKSLGVSRFNFSPTQERFSWLVAAGFPGSMIRATGVRTPLDDADIDAAIAAQGGAA